MSIMYKSTRSNSDKVTASQAILKGLADDGGLFVPDSIPALEVPLEKLADMTYQETAYEVMKLFLSDFTEEELKHCINGAYDDKFDTKEIAPLVKKDGAYYLELFHGKTIAFKDMALSILPYLMTTAAKKNGVKNEIVILTSCIGRFCGCSGNKYYCVLSEKRCQPDSGETDVDTKRRKHKCSRNYRKF